MVKKLVKAIAHWLDIKLKNQTTVMTHDKDLALVNLILEESGYLLSEDDTEAARARIDITAAHQWRAANAAAQEAYENYLLVRRTWFLQLTIEKRVRSLEQKLMFNRACSLDVQRLHLSAREGYERWLKPASDSYSELSDRAFDLSRKLFKPEPRPPAIKLIKDWSKTADYWLGKLLKAESKLQSKQAKLSSINAALKHNCNSDLIRYFPKGSVGGGGNVKGIHRLNKRKEKENNRFFKLTTEKQDVVQAIRRLEAWLHRCHYYYNRAVDKMKTQEQETSVQKY